MQAQTRSYLEALARGEKLPPEVFDAILADSEAIGELAGLLRLGSLFEDDEPLTPVVTDVTLEETALYVRGQLHDPARRAMVEEFLAREFLPEEQPKEAPVARRSVVAAPPAQEPNHGATP